MYYIVFPCTQLFGFRSTLGAKFCAQKYPRPSEHLLVKLCVDPSRASNFLLSVV